MTPEIQATFERLILDSLSESRGREVLQWELLNWAFKQLVNAGFYKGRAYRAAKADAMNVCYGLVKSGKISVRREAGPPYRRWLRINENIIHERNQPQHGSSQSPSRQVGHSQLQETLSMGAIYW